jgi:hypothetical protein
MPKADFEEFYGNKAKFALVNLFSSELMIEICEQIGLEELHHHFNLEPRKVKKARSEIFDENLKYFQERIDSFNKNGRLKISLRQKILLMRSNLWIGSFPKFEKYIYWRFRDNNAI